MNDRKVGYPKSAWQTFLEIITGKKCLKRQQEIIAKCLKQFNMRLFEWIGGSVTGKGKHLWRRRQEKRKSTLRAFSSRGD